MIKNNRKFFAPHQPLRDKFHHFYDLNSPISETLGEAEVLRLVDNNLLKERLATFRNRDLLLEAYVEQFGRDLRLHVVDPDTKIIAGTLGANREAAPAAGMQATHVIAVATDKAGLLVATLSA